MSKYSRTLLVLIGLGLLVTTYLTLKANDPKGVICSIGGACEIVLSSKYAYFLGLPVSQWGLGWYLGSLGLFYLVFIQKRLAWSFFMAWAAAGLAVSLYLLSLEALVIHAYCTWCLISLLITTLIFSLTLISRKELLHNEQ